MDSSKGAPKRGLGAARRSAAVADLSDWGLLRLTGRDRATLLQRISTNDLRPLRSGLLLPTIFVTAKGRIVDRALVLDRGDGLVLLTEPEGRGRLPEWIRRYILTEEVAIEDLAPAARAVALLGPLAPRIAEALAGHPPEERSFARASIGGVEALVAPLEILPNAWVIITDTAGIDRTLAAAAEAAGEAGLPYLDAAELDLLRIEAGLPAAGRELTEDRNPWEARQDALISLRKGCYLGQEVIARLNTYEKVQAHLVGLRLGEAPPPACPCPILDCRGDGSEIAVGELTSAARSDLLGETIGLGYVRVDREAPGTRLRVGPGRVPATVTSLSFG